MYLHYKVVVDTAMKHRPPVRLNLLRIPVLVTLGLAVDTKVILQDPTRREEAIITGGRVMVGLTAHGELCCVHTSGLSTPIHPESLSRCIVMAKSRAKSLDALLHRVLESLERRYAVKIAAATARASDLDRTQKLLLDVPLVLSSASFLHGFENAPDGLAQVEEGEVAGYELDDESDLDNMSLDNSSNGEVKYAARRNPYGVIEVSGLLAQEDKSEDLDGNDLEGNQSIESDAKARVQKLPFSG